MDYDEVVLNRLHTELGLLAGDCDDYAVDALYSSVAQVLRVA